MNSKTQLQKQLADKHKLSSTEDKTRRFSPKKRLIVLKHHICCVRMINVRIRFRSFELKTTKEIPSREQWG